MSHLKIAPAIRTKLANKVPPVTEDEILQCFANKDGPYLIDDREDHLTDPPTEWFVAETDYGRKLKVMFIYDPCTCHVVIKSAYSANDVVIGLYEKKSRSSKQ